jgi:hypothetical protein
VIETGTYAERMAGYLHIAQPPLHTTLESDWVMYMFSGAWVPDLNGTSHSADHLSRGTSRDDHHAS